MPSAHIDTFARDNLPPPELQPEYVFDLPELRFPAQLNCATELLDRHVAQGNGERVCIRAPGLAWTYADLAEKANRIAHVLVRDMGLVPGNRVLLRAPNNPMLVACWFAVMKAGGIAVATMPLLRVKELASIVDIAEVTHALCDAALADDMKRVAEQAPGLRHVRYFNGTDDDGLEADMRQAPAQFDNVDTAADDTCILGFTSGTTGVPKATMHFHRDVMAVCACWPAHVLKPNAQDVFIGSPPLAFTFGLGGLVLFPMSVGACTVLLEKAGPQQLLEGIRDFGATILFTAPTSYRALAAHGQALRGTPLRKCVSAGEALPASTRQLWKEATGIEPIDGIGSTEMLHIFISHDEAHARPGATGTPVPGYRARVVDAQGVEVPPGTVGRLAVQGPTGCRYLADARQREYVQAGWNLTGDAYLMDADGYFHYQARTDDMIVSAGYNIAAPDVEDALMQHPAVAECAVIGAPDEQRGQIVKAFVVLRPGHAADGAMAEALQRFVKATVAPYKYPRAVRFVDSLPRTATGKLQRFRLHELDHVALGRR
ncbi:AMP-binding protein [Verticiella sediminum]|uniref:AMP-binding protein n=1 Tax=Verticiella sediminum TaxID=1247510 RepID=A0A556A9J5_9BURK|nr:AMP-binding protein [Verticiella sediminum]TSH89552.1 AMP-binding protein [Verticiella sediminum]